MKESVKRKLEEERLKTKMGPKAKAAKLEREKPKFAKVTKEEKLRWALKCGYKVNV